MKDIERSIFSIVLGEISSAIDQPAIVSVLLGLASRYGIKSAAYLGSGITSSREKEPYLAVTYSSEWVEHYKQRSYVEIDPVIRMGLGRLLPLDWDELDKTEGTLRSFFGEATEFGLGKRGLSIPVHGRHGDRGLLSITSDLSERDWRREKLLYLRDFQVFATHIHEKVLSLSGRRTFSSNLSPRELECLQWIAEGKTVWECAMILGLSQHTVRCYLESARYKLNATSNTHAVSIAFRAGLLTELL